MGGKKSKAPPTPDYAGLAKQEGDQNRILAQEMTIANRPNQTDIYGNQVNWSRNPKTGQWTQTASLSPQQNAMYQNFMTGQNLSQGIYNNALVRYDQFNNRDNGFGVGDYQNLPGTKGAFQSPQAQQFSAPGAYGVNGMNNAQGNTGVNMKAYGVQGTPGSATNTGVNLGNYGVNAIGQGATNTGVKLGSYGANPLTAGQANTGVNLGNYGVNSIGQGATNTGVNMGQYGLTGITNQMMGNMPQYDQNSGKAVADALYGSVMDRGRVEQQRETDTLTTQLRQQGLQPGTAAFDRAMQNVRTSQNDANLLAAQNATLAGAQEARDIYGAQLAGNQQRFGQLQGQQATNLQNAQFQQGMNQQNYENQLSRQQANLGMAGAQQGMNQQNYANLANNQAQNAALAQQQFGMNQQGFQNQLARQTGNLAMAGAQQGMNQQNFQNRLGAEESNRMNAQFQNQMNNQSLQNMLNIQANNRANWGQGSQNQNNFFQNQIAAAENARANYESQLKGQGQAYGQALGNRNQNIQELAAFQGMAGMPAGTQFQGYGTATGYSPADMMGAANASYAANMGKYNSSQSKKGGLLGSGLQLGGSLLGGLF